jgi:hypothetical protein
VRAENEIRLNELATLDQLLLFKRGKDGNLDSKSFLGILSDARGDANTFGADTKSFAEFSKDPRFVFEAAKQRILLAAGDADAIRAAIYSVHASPVSRSPGETQDTAASRQQAEDSKLRQELLRDPQVATAVGDLSGVDAMGVRGAATADAYAETIFHLAGAFNNARWSEFFDQILMIARNDDWSRRFQATNTDPTSVYVRIQGKERDVMLKILRTPRELPLADMAASISQFGGNSTELSYLFENIGEEQRAQLRLGWSLVRNPISGPLTEQQLAARNAFEEFDKTIRKSQTTLKMFDEAGYEKVLGATLGSAPTAKELSSPTDRHAAAAFLYERVEKRLAVGTGLSAHFTETDETMLAAGREFAALWLQVRDQQELSMFNYTALIELYERFDQRSEEFAEASNTIGEMAGTIAATVAGVVVVAATGGAATPAVIALAAAAGASSRVVTREMFGDQYYSALSDQGARDALLGAVDGALAVVGGSLASRGAQLLGLSGHALTSSAARVAGEVAEQATQPLARRVVAGAVEGAIDGAFSGATSEAFGTLTDDRTWRRGIVAGLARTGRAALLGGLTGLGGGAVIGGALPILGAGGRRIWDAVTGRSLEESIRKACAEDALAAARAAAKRGDVKEVKRLATELENHLNAKEAAALRQELGDALSLSTGVESPWAQTRRGMTAGKVRSEGDKITICWNPCNRLVDYVLAAREASEFPDALTWHELENMASAISELDTRVRARPTPDKRILEALDVRARLLKEEVDSLMNSGRTRLTVGVNPEGNLSDLSSQADILNEGARLAGDSADSVLAGLLRERGSTIHKDVLTAIRDAFPENVLIDRGQAAALSELNLPRIDFGIGPRGGPRKGADLLVIDRKNRVITVADLTRSGDDATHLNKLQKDFEAVKVWAAAQRPKWTAKLHGEITYRNAASVGEIVDTVTSRVQTILAR